MLRKTQGAYQPTILLARSPPFLLEKIKEPNLCLSPTGKIIIVEEAELRLEDCNFAAINFRMGCVSQEAANKTKQNRTKQSKPTNQTTKTNDQPVEQPNDQQITKPPENQTIQHPASQQIKFNKPHKTLTNPTNSNQNKTRKKQTKQIKHPTNEPPTHPAKQTNRLKKQKRHFRFNVFGLLELSFGKV